MPELPEVETVVRTLEHQIHNQKIENVIVRYPKMIDCSPATFKKKLVGQHFRRFDRRGKYLLFYLDDILLVVHLRMEGKFFIQKKEEPINKHIHVVFQLNGKNELRYQDTRKFGRMELLPLNTDLKTFHELGPEPFEEEFNASYIKNFLKGKSCPVKSLLLDQSFVAGIGNIYADEILFACRIRPGRSVKRLTYKDCENIVFYTRDILNKAIQAGGTTIRSYTSSLGVTGRFQLSCQVHAQKFCGTCGNEIHVKWIGGRSSYYCPKCQEK